MRKTGREERRAAIRDILKERIVETQEDLARALRERGIDVTQATVSRDIKELLLVKVPFGFGRSRYVLPNDKQEQPAFSSTRVARLLADTVLGLDASENIIVVHTLPGAANAVAAALDHARWPQVIGTIAGDDTIFLVVKPQRAVTEVLSLLETLRAGEAGEQKRDVGQEGNLSC